MTALIKRTDAITAIHDEILKRRINNEDEIDEFDTESILRSLPVVNQWTFVEDELPEEVRSPGHGLCHVLVTTTKNFHHAVEQEIYMNGKFFFRGEEDTKVLAWMHLPMPCKKEQ